MTELNMVDERIIYIGRMAELLDGWSAHVNVLKSKVANRSVSVTNGYHSCLSHWYEKKVKFRTKIEEIQNGDIKDFESLRFHAQQARTEALTAYNAVIKT